MNEPTDAVICGSPPSGGLSDQRHPTGMRRALRAFQHRDFSIFWSGALASNIGSWVQNMTVPYVLYDVTGSAFWVGFATFAQFIPLLVLGPIGGAIADRAGRRRVLVVSQALLAIAATLLWIAWIADARTLPVILGLVTLSGAITAISIPTWHAFVNDLVAPDALMSAITLNSLQINASRAIGPALAGVILATAGPSLAFLVNAVSFGFVLIALVAVRADAPPRRPMGPTRVLAEFHETLGYVRAQPGILIGLVITFIVGFFANPVQALTVVFAADEFDAGPTGLALLNIALGLGAVGAFVTVSGWDHITTRARMTLGWMTIYSAAIVAFALTPSLGAALIPLALVGAGFLAVISITNTSTQYIVADRIRGRVLALRIMCFSGAYPLGSLVQGWAADRIGVRPTVAGAGAIMFVTTVALCCRPSLTNRLDDPHDASDR